MLVDASEGPLPQTRFVLRKTLEARLPVICVINKMDRADARAAEVVDAVYELFLDLGADEHQIEFPIVYCNARAGQAALAPDDVAASPDLKVLFDLLIERIPAPEYEEGHPFQALVTNLDASPYVGRLALCRIRNGRGEEGGHRDLVPARRQHRAGAAIGGLHDRRRSNGSMPRRAAPALATSSRWRASRRS